MKIKIKNFSIFLLMAGYFVSCSSGKVMTTEDLNNLLMDYNRGLIAGVDIGDDWNEVKSNLNKRWNIEEETTESVRIGDDFNNIDTNRVYVSMNLDSNQKVQGIEVGILGKDSAKLPMRKFYKKLEYRASQIAKPAETKGWYSMEKDGVQYDLMLKYSELSTSDSIDFQIMKK